MIETIKWKEVYSLWEYGTYRFPELLTDPIPVETVFVDYNREGYIYMDLTGFPMRMPGGESN